MKKTNYFLAFPFSVFCEDDSDILSNDAIRFFKNLTSLFKDNELNYYSAQERESWGKTYHSETESTLEDFNALKKCSTMICVPGYPYSGGTNTKTDFLLHFYLVQILPATTFLHDLLTVHDFHLSFQFVLLQ